jgi:hypothetical protein
VKVVFHDSAIVISDSELVVKKKDQSRIEDHYQWQKIAEEIERTYLKILGKDLPKAQEKKPSGTAVIPAQDQQLRRHAG